MTDAHSGRRTAERLHPGMRASKAWEAVADVWVRDALPEPERTQFVEALQARRPR